jgi:zinc protease
VPRKDPDFHTITVMNAILGGLFNSRINLNLRERHAFTYGAFSSFDWRRHGSLFEVSTAVRSDVTAAALTEILSEIDRICEADVSESELSLARDYLTGVFPIRFETTTAIASAIATQESFGLDPAYYDEYRDRIAAVSVGDVRRVAERILNPSRLQILAVGDPEMIRGPIEAMELGEVHEIVGRQQPTSTVVG